MKKHRNIIIIVISILVSISLIVTLNIFESKNSNNGQILNTEPFVKIYGKEYSKENLPSELRLFLYNKERLDYFSILTLIKSFAVKYVNLKLTKGKSINDVPTTEEFFSTLVTDEEIESFHKNNIAKYGETESGKLSAQVDLRTKKIGEVLEVETGKLINSGDLKILRQPPVAPLELFNLQKFPTIGSNSASKTLIVISSFSCLNCIKYNQQFTDIFKKYNEQIKLIFIPHAKDFNSASGLFVKSALCVYNEDKENYWHYHNSLFNNPAASQLNPTDMFSASQIINDSLAKLNIANAKIFNCLQDKKIDMKFMSDLRNINLLNFIYYPMVLFGNYELEVKDDLLKSIEQVTF